MDWFEIELCRIGTEEQSEWYFFSHKDKKYPTGTRTNRATAAGFWKATGRDKAIYARHDLIGMRKTLVFYKGRAPNGQKSDWIMHEYRLESDENGPPQASSIIIIIISRPVVLMVNELILMLKQEEGWVVCRVFKKRMATLRKVISQENESTTWYDDQMSFIPDMDSTATRSTLTYHYHYPNYNTCKKEIDLHQQIQQHNHHHFLQLPLLENSTPKLMQSQLGSCNSVLPDSHHYNNALHSSLYTTNNNNEDGVTDWRVLDKFVASQLSQEEVVSKENGDDYSNGTNNNFHASDDTNAVMVKNLENQENVSTSSSSCQIDLWK